MTDLLIDELADAMVAGLLEGWTTWPSRHIMDDNGVAVPFHPGQDSAWDSERRIVAVIAGSQGGKTAWGPWWLAREIERCGGGDHLAITSSYDLFKLKMLPALLQVFEGVLGIGRYWGGDRLIEIAHPTQGFGATHSHDHDKMYGRIILRSAQAGRIRGQVAVSGLEATTARSAWLDEAGQEGFNLAAWRSILRRLSLAEGRILITTTLYNHGWIKREVMDRADKEGKKQLNASERGELEITDSKEEDICLIQYDSTINPSYPLAEFERAKADLPLDEFQMFYRGRIAKMRHLVYDSFDRKKHTIPRFAIPVEWKRYVGLDFGAINTAALFYAKDPGGQFYCYRAYTAGNRTATGHAAHITMGEPRLPTCYGGSASEKQWRKEFAAAGLPVRTPRISNVGVAINMVYAAHKQDKVIYFDDLEDVFEEKERYRWKRDREGNRTDEIEGKSSFHRLDAERYVLSSVLGGRGVYFG